MNHVRHSGKRGKVLLQARQSLLRRPWQRLHEEASRRENRKVGRDENAERDGRRRLLRIVEVLRQILGDFARQDLARANDRLLESREARDRDEPCANARAYIELSCGVQRQIHLRVIDAAAHESLGHGIRHDRPQGTVTRKLHGQRLLVLEICREQERPRHRAPKRRRRHGVAVVPTHRLADERRRPRCIDAKIACDRLDQGIFHTETASFFHARRASADRVHPPCPVVIRPKRRARECRAHERHRKKR